MLATVLTVASLDPTLVIGGKVDSLGGNAKLGQGKFVVAEADESDGSFLHLPATYGVITNIDNDHLDHYGDIKGVEEAFIDFVGKIPFYGLVAVCGEDPGVRRCLDRFTKPVTTYGFSSQWDFFANNIETVGTGSSFEVWQAVPTQPHRRLGKITLQVPGKHNVLNALSAVAIALKLEISFEKIAVGLGQFGGVKRRFETRWRNAETKQAVVDDYAHHPTEIVATLAAAKQVWSGRIFTVFQPHRYSRTLHCAPEFMNAFKDANVVYVTDIYAAGEDPIEGVTSKHFVADLARHSTDDQTIKYTGSLDDTKAAIISQFKPGDLLLCLGAGSITKLAEQIAIYAQGIKNVGQKRA